MALLLIEGFDHEATQNYTEGGGGNRMFQKGFTGATVPPVNFVDGRMPYSANSHALTVIQNNPFQKIIAATHAPIVIGFGIKFNSSVFLTGYTFFTMSSTVTGQTYLTVTWNTAGRIQVRDHAGTVTTGTTQIFAQNWHYIEFKMSTSTIEVHLDGVSGEIPSTAGSFGAVDTFQWLPGGLGSDIFIDDLYILETTSGVNTDFLGDVVVETLYPISDGTYTQWTPDTGSTHYVRVDESQMDNDTSYLHTTTTGAKDSYPMGDPVLSSTPVYGVQLNLAAKKNDGGGRTIAPFIRQSGTDYIGPITALTADWFFHSWLLEQDPTGSNWLYTTVNNDEFGAELVS